jgi:hypothetical protein
MRLYHFPSPNPQKVTFALFFLSQHMMQSAGEVALRIRAKVLGITPMMLRSPAGKRLCRM